MPLGTRIRKAREHVDISQAELARRIGITLQRRLTFPCACPHA